MDHHGIQRRTRLKPFNPNRRARSFERQFGGLDRLSWLQRQPCVVPGCRATRCHAHHIRTRAAGGVANDQIPLCSRHHREVHDLGKETFEARYQLNLVELAAHFASRWGAL